MRMRSLAMAKTLLQVCPLQSPVLWDACPQSLGNGAVCATRLPGGDQLKTDIRCCKEAGVAAGDCEAPDVVDKPGIAGEPEVKSRPAVHTAPGNESKASTAGKPPKRLAEWSESEDE